jgi:hypothetical protein
MSGKAAGTVAVVWRGVQYFRKLNPSPKNPQSADQQLTRASVKKMTQVWQHIATVVNAAWVLFAKGRSVSGFNEFVKANVHDQILAGFMTLCPANPNIHPLASLALGATAATTQVITWAPGDAVGTLKVEVAIYKKIKPLLPETVVEADAIPAFTSHNTVLVSAATITATGLVTATPYTAMISVWDPVTGELAKSLSIDFTTT